MIIGHPSIHLVANRGTCQRLKTALQFEFAVCQRTRKSKLWLERAIGLSFLEFNRGIRFSMRTLDCCGTSRKAEL